MFSDIFLVQTRKAKKRGRERELEKHIFLAVVGFWHKIPKLKVLHVIANDCKELKGIWSNMF